MGSSPRFSDENEAEWASRPSGRPQSPLRNEPGATRRNCETKPILGTCSRSRTIVGLSNEIPGRSASRRVSSHAGRPRPGSSRSGRSARSPAASVTRDRRMGPPPSSGSLLTRKDRLAVPLPENREADGDAATTPSKGRRPEGSARRTGARERNVEFPDPDCVGVDYMGAMLPYSCACPHIPVTGSRTCLRVRKHGTGQLSAVLQRTRIDAREDPPGKASGHSSLPGR